MTTKHRVILADDHVMVAEALGDYLQRGGFDLVAVVPDGKSLVEAALRLRPEVIVTDIAMPKLSGLDAMSRLRSQSPAAKFVFLTMSDDTALACEALRLGASAYLLKHSAGEELVSAIHEALQGRTYLTPRIAKDVIASLAIAGDQSSMSSRLTSRQREVLELVVIGRSMKEVAACLKLSPRTVETHKYGIMQALGVKTTAELIHYALRHHMVSDDDAMHS